MDEDERAGRDAELAEHMATLAAIQAEWGFAPDETPPPEVGSALLHISQLVSHLAKTRFGCEPTALRWMGVSLQYWVRAMRLWADSAEQEIGEWAERLDADSASTSDG